MLPEGQTGFRKGRGVVDNIYTLNFVVEREIARGRSYSGIRGPESSIRLSGQGGTGKEFGGKGGE